MKKAIACFTAAWVVSVASATVEGTWNSVSITVPEYAPFTTNNWVANTRYFTVAENGDLRDITTNPSAGISGSVVQYGGAAVFDSNFIDSLLFVDESEQIMSGMFRYASNAIGMAVCLKAPETNDIANLQNSTWNYIEYRYPVYVSFNGNIVHESSDTPFSETGTLSFNGSGGFTLTNPEFSVNGTVSALSGLGQFQVQASVPGEGTLTIPIAINASYDTLAWITADSESVGLYIAVRRANDLVIGDMTGYWDAAILDTPTDSIFFDPEAQFHYEQENGVFLLRGAEKGYAIFEGPESGTISVNASQSSIGFASDDDDEGVNQIFINAGKTFGIAVEQTPDDYNSLGIFSRRAGGSANVADAQVGSILLSLRPDETGYDFTFDIKSSDHLGGWTSIYNDTVVIPAQGDSQFLRLTAEQ